MPTITSITPTSGPTTGGTSVTITGTGFTGPLTVRFGSTATTFTIDSAIQLTAIAPAGSAGPVQVTVSDSSGTSNGATYTYLAVPSLSSIAPGQGSTSGGTTVTLTGSGLTGATAVTFGTTPATSFTVDSDTQITAVAPAGTGIVSVTVTAPGGTSNGVAFVYVVVPTISALTPTSGPTSGGNNVTISGTGFTGPLTVRFGDTATTFTVDSALQITAVAPAHAAGDVQVTVTGSGGTSNGATYSYV
ncbi:IPT/TIG domain-containing protein [Nocardia sp. CY41]|uniref:IPT/TIG domain-containing protein n=1 Tax=Nocardia sp. CY41 TaxID=2608686 RepID=UPI0019152FB5|nr:IPT/TIG domain-containing protein [Nocardia sp. CY41]